LEKKNKNIFWTTNRLKNQIVGAKKGYYKNFEFEKIIFLIKKNRFFRKTEDGIMLYAEWSMETVDWSRRCDGTRSNLGGYLSGFLSYLIN